MTRTEAERLRKATVLLRAAEGRTADALVLMLDMVEQALRDFDAEDKAVDRAHDKSVDTVDPGFIEACPERGDR